MATTTFIKFDGIDGESTSKDHKGEIEVLSWHWGLTTTVVTSGGGGGSASKPSAKEFRFVHRYDKASPLLAKAAITGKHLKTAALTARKAGAGQKDFFRLTMTDVLVTSVGDSGDGTGITEELTLLYGEIDVSYKQQDVKGALGAEVTFDWNVRTGKVT